MRTMFRWSDFPLDLDDDGTLTIYEPMCHLCLCTISDCGDMQPDEIEELVKEVLYEMGYEVQE